MSILSDTILTDVNARLNLSETDIDAKILRAIQKIVSVVPGIAETTSTVTVADAAYTGTLPTDFAVDLAVTDSAGKPLERVDNVVDLLALMHSNATANATLTSYAIFGDSLYVHPPSSGGHTLTIFYEYADASADSITLPDCAYEALTELVCAQLELERGMVGNLTEQASGHERIANEELAVLQARYARRKR